ncbi:acyl-CoA thioester hydrolase [Pullulanibacillus pueri]|uniref:Thioesterase n=1 Tax=Pullulanibacillus pueri TaxID=1437324 RepID=A0A8J2ZUI5_9BACL|nr:acyl-CoA thioesterase [Pullulanibacillus pueri]MBM7680731.1 acyl-CoA thioester hydrolase [Pullulanibacillus pueri]GGH78116.1 thioesterase [Pullulanibacillus pueri]
MYTYDLSVRFSDCDALQHVNNAVYFTYFETARSELFQLFNQNLSFENWNIIMASTRCEFLEEIHFPQTVTVVSWISRIGRSSFVVEHAIHDESGHWKARGNAVLLQYDFKNKTSLPLEDKIRHELLKHQQGPKGVPELR